MDNSIVPRLSQHHIIKKINFLSQVVELSLLKGCVIHVSTMQFSGEISNFDTWMTQGWTTNSYYFLHSPPVIQNPTPGYGQARNICQNFFLNGHYFYIVRNIF
jgi:hypothetical protein